MNPPETPNVERSVQLAFVAMGWFYLLLSPPALCAGAFTGPHILFPALGLIVAGATSIAVGMGLANGLRGARVLGIVLAAFLTAVSTFTIVGTLADPKEQWPTRLLLALMNAAFVAPVTVAGATLLRGELKRRRQTSAMPPASGPISN